MKDLLIKLSTFRGTDQIKDCKEEAPHSGFGMMSPLEYKKQIK
jgi:hypothetical protein